MTIITARITESPADARSIVLMTDRFTLAKRRWRAKAEDGVEFGFDLDAPLNDGEVFHVDENGTYSVQQLPEPVLEIVLISSSAPVARLGWTIGNLHFPIQVTEEVIRVPDDIALRQLLEREKIPYSACERVFLPFAKTHGHES